MATWPTLTDDDGSNTTGTVVNNANVWTPIQNYINNGGTSVAHAGGNFTASSGSWTVASGDQSAFAYVEVGKMMCVTFTLVTTSVSATPNELRIAIPNSRTAARTMAAGMFAYSQSGTPGTGLAVVSGGGTTLLLYRDITATAWSTTTNLTSVQGTVWFEIQ